MCRRGKLQEKFGKWGQAFKTDKKKKIRLQSKLLYILILYFMQISLMIRQFHLNVDVVFFSNFS